ncbi:hypothetical protein J2Y55_002152 [Bosea sp. BE125]|uniref:hypothetical protein n=1 Tax=Bosea sp. BE125 TaxID=2817909 RepID=UPI002864A931|nr:hypothetical protein [Bosea sp. BE125]MDR6871144.1 hypothetical protein [Bosea sp. BE125]
MNTDSAISFLSATCVWLKEFVQSPILLEYAKIAADVVKSVAWPGAMILIMLLFKREIRPLIDRIVRVGPGGVELGPRSAEKQGEAKVSEPDTLEQPHNGPLRELPGRSRSVAQADLEIKLQQSLQDLIKDGKLSPESQVDLLINELAGTRLTALFDRLYSFIFGSQIRGLIHLNQFGSAELEEVKALYDKSKAADPAFYGEYSFEGWFGFLRDSGLIQIDGAKIALTPLGQDFVRYLTTTGKILDKRG